MASLDEQLKPYALLGGYNAAELWPLTNLILPTWILLLVAPSWKHTQKLTLIGPVFFAIIYTLGFLSLQLFPESDEPTEMDFTTLEGVVGLFKDPNAVFLGWVHYIIYDPLVGRWIALDAQSRGCTTKLQVLVMAPVLVLALMFAPAGWLLYLAVVRPFLLPQPSKDKSA